MTTFAYLTLFVPEIFGRDSPAGGTRFASILSNALTAEQLATFFLLFGVNSNFQANRNLTLSSGWET